jgi:uncharacterized protein (TIGR00369 family)
MSPRQDVPAGFVPLTDAGGFVDHVGPLHVREADGVLGVRVEDRHLNAAGTAMGGFLSTLVDVALGGAIREDAEGDTAAATVSLTVDFLRPGPAGAWLQATTKVERLTGRLAFADCSVRADDDEVVRARAVFVVRSED